MPKPFKFKQFIVHQNKSAMKVGTDGVLLGAWVNLNNNPFNVLDIGSGTGLISLMLAQRSNATVIDAVELNESAYIQTVENFEQSKWADRLFCYHASFQEFATEINETYDLIISNPPFYSSTYKHLEKDRAMARHSESLPTAELLKGVVKLLSEQGSCAFIIPYSEMDNFVALAESMNLILARVTNVKGMVDSPIKRSILQFSYIKQPLEQRELIIEYERHIYTPEYIDLVHDFYLKM